MKLFLRFLLVCALLICALFAVLAVVSHTLIDKQYRRLEQEQVQHGILAARDVFRDELSRMHALCLDWANWDALFEFCHNGRQNFVKENILPRTLEVLEINYLLIINKDRKPLSETAVSLPSAEMVPPPTAFKIRLMEEGYFDRVLTGKSVQGFMNLGQSILAFTAEPVLKSDSSGEPAGVIVFGSFLEGNIATRVRARLGKNYSFLPFTDQSRHSPQEMPITLDSHGVVPLTTFDKENVSGSLLFGDISGIPAFVLLYKLPRTLYESGIRLWIDLLWSILFVLLATLGCIFPLLHMPLILRLRNLNNYLQEFLRGNEPEKILSTKGNGPVAQLTHATAKLLEKFRTEHQAHEIAIRRLKVAFDSAPDAILLCDLSTRDIVDCNAALEAMLGFTRDRIIGQVFEFIVPPGEKYCYILDHLARQPHYSGELEVQNAEGDRLPVLLRSETFFLEGRPMLQAALHDISDVRQAQEREERAKNGLAAASRRRSDFITTVSHEMRTPLSALLGFTDLAEEAQSPRETAGWLRNIRRESSHLLELVNDLLDHARIEAGKVSIRPLNTDLRKFLQDLSITVQALLHNKKGVRFFLNLADNIEESYLVDSLRLRQILLNLLENAVKFTPRGSITLRVEAEAIDEENYLLFSVTDTGIGIPEEAQPHIFESFRQADDNISREYGGTGLGTAIASKLAQLMNGKLTLRSAVGQGSEFTLRLPCSQATTTPKSSTSDENSATRDNLTKAAGTPTEDTGDSATPYTPSATAPYAAQGFPAKIAQPSADALEITSSGTNSIASSADAGQVAFDKKCPPPANVLLVEDYALNRQVASAFIRHAGHNLFTSFNGRDAVEKAKNRPFDLILMDVQLPILDGLEATRQIRAQGCNRSTPIIGLTAYAETKTITACRAAGMNDVLAKPFTKEDFYAMLERTVGQICKSDTSATEAERLPRDYIVQHFFFGKRELAERALDIFLKDAQPLLASIARGCEEGDTTIIQHNAHQIKSGAGYLGLSTLQDVCQSITEQARTGLTDGIEDLLREALAEYQRLRSLRAPA